MNTKSINDNKTIIVILFTLFIIWYIIYTKDIFQLYSNSKPHLCDMKLNNNICDNSPRETEDNFTTSDKCSKYCKKRKEANKDISYCNFDKNTKTCKLFNYCMTINNLNASNNNSSDNSSDKYGCELTNNDKNKNYKNYIYYGENGRKVNTMRLFLFNLFSIITVYMLYSVNNNIQIANVIIVVLLTLWYNNDWSMILETNAGQDSNIREYIYPLVFIFCFYLIFNSYFIVTEIDTQTVFDTSRL